MSERGTEVRARLTTMRELEEVLGAMRGMAAARIQQGERAQLAAREYAGRIGAAWASISAENVPGPDSPAPESTVPTLVIALCTERGFVGALNEHVLRAATERARGREILLVGTRGLAFAREQAVSVTYAGSMATHLGALGDVADQVGDLLLKRASGDPMVVEVIHPRRGDTGGTVIERRRLLPLDLPSRTHCRGLPPITMLPPQALAAQIAGEYVHARLFEFVAESFAAANAASLEVLQAAHTHLDDMLVELRRTENVLRQEEITAEVLEVITGRLKSPH